MDYKEALGLADNVEGTLVELGFGKGNSLKEFISYMNKKDIVKRNIWIYESFDGYGAPTPEDQGAFVKGGFKRPIQPAFDIRNTIDKEVKLIKGYIENTLPESYDTKEPVAIIHTHLVSYSSTLFGLSTLANKVADNGIIVVTDYKEFPGTKLAVDTFVESSTGKWQLISADGFIILKKIKLVNLSTFKVTRSRTPLV